MTLGQASLVNNYNSLKSKVNSDSIGLMLRFCSFFQSDDVNLFKEYEGVYYSGESVDDLISLYAKRYNLNPENDIEKIMYLFLENTINNGVSYHLGSSANCKSIIENGLGTASTGIQTEEMQDYMMLKNSVYPDIFKKLLPFDSVNWNKLYYSNVPILNARYGSRPEWLQELKINSYAVVGTGYENLINSILEKYDNKYSDSEKILFIIPNPIKIPTEYIEKLLQSKSHQDIMSYFLYNVLNQKDLHTDKHIPSSEMVILDAKENSLYPADEYLNHRNMSS